MSTTMVPSAVDAVASALRGRVVRPGDDDYDTGRAVYNGNISRRPAAIAYCADVADVIAAVRTAREQGALVSVRGGGHNAAGLGVCDGGICIDLSRLRGIKVDPASKTVRVEGGCTWSDVDHATHPFGLATPSGILGTTGVGGLTLGGGSGHLTRRFGLTIDNLLAADVVLADGSFVTASADEHSDLFWALRGGGGNFGIVTSFLFRCHDVSTLMAGPVLYDVSDTGDVLRWYREVLPSLPEEINGWFAVMTVPPAPPFPEALAMRKVCAILWSYSGPMDRAEEALAPVRSFGTPLIDGIHEVPYPALQGAFDALFPPGLQWYWRGAFFSEISDAAVAVHEKYAVTPSMHSTMHMYPVDGAAHRVAPDDTAFAYREAIWNTVFVGVDPDPANFDTVKTWAQNYSDELFPHSDGGAYVNFMGAEGEDRVKAAYRGNYDRLARIKATYDPDNFFRMNQNIPPAKR